MMKLSIIVPAYNVENYIEQCLSSLLKQGFNDDEYEIIVIDDGSKDKTLKISEEFSAKYRQIKLIKVSPNKGVSSARNLGIQESKGEYITFVDADDVVSVNIYKPILEIMKTDNIDCFRFNRTHDYNRLQKFNGIYQITEEKYVIMPVWLVIYKRDVLIKNKIQFANSISYREDFLFNYQYLQSTTPFFTVSFQPLYFNRLNDSSTTSNLFVNPIKFDKCYNSYLNVASEIKENQNYPGFDSDLYKLALSNMVSALVWLSIRGRIKPKQFLNDLKMHKLNLSDIKMKIFEGLGFSHRIKTIIEYHSRFKVLYKFHYRIYPILNFFIRYKGSK